MTPDKANSLANDIACAIATLQAVADELMTAYPDSDYDRDDDTITSDPIGQKSEPESKELTFVDVRKALMAKADAGFREQVQAAIQKRAAKLSLIEPADYPALIAEVEALK